MAGFTVPNCCPRCNLVHDGRITADGKCPACLYPLMPRASLVLPDGSTVELKLTGQTIGRDHVGRHSEARTVSRRHLRMFFDTARGAWCVIRLSAARTEINGVEMPHLGRISISDGDTLILGAISMTFHE